MKVAFISLGCAKNLVNTEQMMALCRDAGYTLLEAPAGADAVVINTCGFIDSAKEEAIDTILSVAALKAEGQVGKILVTGCLTQRYQQEILDELPEVDGIYLRIAEGCDNRCAYCVIPSLRGRYRSRRMEDVLAEAKHLADAGVKECIVIAQDITRYGIDLYGEKKLAALLRELCKLDFRWIRLHYLYPDEFTDELIDTIAAEEKVLPYLDIPIQHCNDRVLKAMNRRGDKAELLALFRKLRARIPDLVLRTSLITGLPFEDEAAFEELCEFLQEVRIERAGVFPYSPEEGTPAARMLNRVDTAEAERRAELVVDVQSRIMDDFNDSRMGTVAEVLCDGFDQEAMQFVGRSYAESPDIDGRIYFTADHEVEAGEFVPVRITGAMDGELTGELAE